MNLKLEELTIEQKIGLTLTARRFEQEDLEFIKELIHNHALACLQIPINSHSKELIHALQAEADYPLLFINDMERGYPLSGLPQLPAMILMDCVMRYTGALSNPASHDEESFYDGLLEYPQYTKPREFMGLEVPEVLLSGDHGKIDRWRLEKAVEITREKRPDLLLLHPEIEESLKPKKKRRCKAKD